MPNNNRTINERAAAKQIRAEMDAEQTRRREMEAAIVRKHRAGGGPRFGSHLESPRSFQVPKVDMPG